MQNKMPSTEEYRTLYDLMGKIKEIAPWDELEEVDLFAVQNPHTEEIGFISIMGSLGEHYSIVVYRGEEGLREFWNFQESEFETELTLQRIIEMPQLQASFEDRDYLFKEDHKTIKKLGLTFRGKSAWPMFRSYQPGFMPWFINSAEAQFLIMALEQTIEVSQRADEDPAILLPDDGNGYLLRKRTSKGGQFVWQDFVWHESALSNQIEFLSDMIAFEKLKSLPHKKMAVEMDVFMSHHSVMEKDGRPYYPYVLMLLETEKGLILGHKVIPPLPNLAAMWRKMPSIIADSLLKLSYLPMEIYVESEKLFSSLSHMQDYLNSSVSCIQKLFVASEARKSFLNFGKRQAKR